MADKKRTHVTWIEDENRWGLEMPPNWFLDGLNNYDPYLRLSPSRFENKYLLQRRRQLTGGLGEVAMLGNKHPDTLMCHKHGTLPIAPLKFKPGVQMWTMGSLNSLLEELKARDLWANGQGPENPDAVIKRIEADEEAARKKQRADMVDGFKHMARDAYRSLKARIGARNKRASDYHGAAQAPNSGGGIIITDNL